MSKSDTPRVRMGKYIVSSHAQNRIANPERDLRESDMLWNSLENSMQSKPYKHRDGIIRYDRSNRHNQTLTNITCDKKALKSIGKYHKMNGINQAISETIIDAEKIKFSQKSH